MPEEVTFTNGNSTKFFYSAEGEKLRAVHTTGGTTNQVDYCGNIIYEAGEQKYLLNQEGYYNLAAGGYHYYLKDHLGNNRVVITQSGAVEQTTHYYPYGGTFASTSNGSNTQPYKYNGKELDAHNGLNWYDYGARHYDPAIARWTTQDPLAEKYYGLNPYNYCAANPENAIDKEGKLILFINGFHVDSKETANSAYWNNFDNAIKSHFNDDNFLYFDGSIGGLSSLFKKTDLNKKTNQFGGRHSLPFICCSRRVRLMAFRFTRPPPSI